VLPQFLADRRHQQVIAGHTGEHPGHTSRVNAPVRGCRIDQRQLGLSHHLLSQVGRGAIDSADDRPYLVAVHDPCESGHSAGPRILLPRGDQPKRQAAIASLPIRLFDRQIRALPDLPAIRIRCIRRTEIADPHFLDIGGFGIVAARTVVRERGLPCITVWLRGGVLRHSGKGQRQQGRHEVQPPPVAHRASLLRRRLQGIDRTGRPVHTVARRDIAARDVQVLARVVVPAAILVLRQEHLTQIVQ
jgi:hypothetical protein